MLFRSTPADRGEAQHQNEEQTCEGPDRSLRPMRCAKDEDTRPADGGRGIQINLLTKHERNFAHEHVADDSARDTRDDAEDYCRGAAHTRPNALAAPRIVNSPSANASAARRNLAGTFQ